MSLNDIIKSGGPTKAREDIAHLETIVKQNILNFDTDRNKYLWTPDGRVISMLRDDLLKRADIIIKAARANLVRTARVYVKGAVLQTLEDFETFLDISRMTSSLRLLNGHVVSSVNPKISSGDTMIIESANAMGYLILISLIGDSVNGGAINVTSFITSNDGFSADSIYERNDTFQIEQKSSVILMQNVRPMPRISWTPSGGYVLTNDDTRFLGLTPADFMFNYEKETIGRTINTRLDISGLGASNMKATVYPVFFASVYTELLSAFANLESLDSDSFDIAMRKIVS